MSKIRNCVLILMILQSCSHKVDCSNETAIFKRKIDAKIKSVYKHPRRKATYVIELFGDKDVIISPAQSIVYSAGPGDRLKKLPYEFSAELITTDQDTFLCSLTSSTCDYPIKRDLGLIKKHKRK